MKCLFVGGSRIAAQHAAMVVYPMCGRFAARRYAARRGASFRMFVDAMLERARLMNLADNLHLWRVPC